MKRVFLITLTLTALIVNLTGCGNHTKAFEQFVRDGNYAEAITLYQEKLMDDSESYAICQEMIQTYLEESLTAYAQGDISRIEAEEVLHTMEMLEDYLYLVDGLEESHTLYSDLRNSKNDFREAEQYRKNGELERALEAYSCVLPEDTENFSTARENMEALQQQMEESHRNAIIQAYESKDYPAVFQAYRDAERSRYVAITEDLTEIRETAVAEYLLFAAEQAEQAFGGSARDYNAAMESLRIARAAVGEEPDLLTELEAMAEEYKAYIPVKLADLRPVRQGTHVSVGTYYSDLYTDINGDTYDKDSVISPTGTMAYDGVAKSDDDGGAVYNLNYAYNTFTATIYRPYGFLSYGGELFENMSVVRIYGDDVMLYEFLDPGESWDVCSVEVDVSGVRNLKIVVRGSWNSTTALIAPANWQPRICLAEGVLQK
ncbi:MAG: hypothetical protein IJN20_03855 [Oscillospiraceae bacterium]|nr:hypothetical protein [Oscillospiraceae bacterium]